MANEIKIACDFWPTDTRDAGAYVGMLTLTNNEFEQMGVILPDSVMARLCFQSSEPLPTNYASGATLWIGWKTASADTSGDAQIGYEIEDSVPETTVEDWSTWGIDTAATDKSAGAGILNWLTVSLSAIAPAVGSFVKGTISRDAQVTNGSDTLAADIQIVHVLLVGTT